MRLTPPALTPDWIKLLWWLFRILWTTKEGVRIQRPNVCALRYSLIDFSEFREELVSINWPAPMLAAPYGEVWL